ncbi:HAD family phosphatase [Candidatus Marsarchaeota archaeon]|jgi:putative hydrolase of the HAD superfamily|nr:HAD family phosphatase [Candidatus Marsarchaeota archaeon]
MIKLLIFDLGNVLLKYDDSQYYEYVSKKYGFQYEKVASIMERHETEMYTGRMKNSEFLHEVSKSLHIPVEKLEFEKYFIKKAKVNKGLLNFALSLKPRYKVVILTNVYRSRYKSMPLVFDKSPFDRVFASCFIRMRKPSKNSYRYVLKKCKAKPEEAIFIDDRKENVAGAEKAGIKSILFRGNKSLFEKLSKFGINQVK